MDNINEGYCKSKPWIAYSMRQKDFLIFQTDMNGMYSLLINKLMREEILEVLLALQLMIIEKQRKLGGQRSVQCTWVKRLHLPCSTSTTFRCYGKQWTLDKKRYSLYRTIAGKLLG